MERALVLTTDVDDFVYGEMWARAIALACRERGLGVELHVVARPGADLAGELGREAPPLPVDPAIRLTRHAGAASALAGIEASAARVVLASARASELASLHASRPRGEAPWVLWDRHLETDLGAAPDAQRAFARIAAARPMHVFTFRSLGTHGNRFVAAGIPQTNVHVDRWCNARWLWSSRSLPLEGGRVRVFAGGNSARDYDLFARALADVPVEACCVTERPVPLVGATVVPRLPLHRFRDAMSVCDVVAIPLAHDTLAGIGTLVLAMGLGKAVVMSDVRFARTYAAPDREAVLTPLGDAAAMGEAIRALASDPARRAAMGAAAAARASRELDLADFARRMVAAGMG